MYICKNCGAQVDDTSMFCGECGTPVDRTVMTAQPVYYQQPAADPGYTYQPVAPAPAPAPAEPPKSRSKGWMIAVIILGAVLLLVVSFTVVFVVLMRKNIKEMTETTKEETTVETTTEEMTTTEETTAETSTEETTGETSETSKQNGSRTLEDLLSPEELQKQAKQMMEDDSFKNIYKDARIEVVGNTITYKYYYKDYYNESQLESIRESIAESGLKEQIESLKDNLEQSLGIRPEKISFIYYTVDDEEITRVEG